MKDNIRILLAVGIMGLALMLASKAWSAETIDLDSIAQIESSGNAHAFNKGSQARGLFQITPICLRHYNSAHRNKITLDELFDAKNNKEVAKWYFGWLESQTNSVDEMLIAYNWGIGNLWNWNGDYEKLPKETRDYIRKYHLTAERK